MGVILITVGFMQKSLKFNHYTLLLFSLLIYPLFASKIYAQSYWSANGNDIYNNNSDQVGIGTTSPAYDLDISGLGEMLNIKSTSGAAAMRLDSTTSTASHIYFLENGTKNFDIYWSAASDYLAFRDTGNTVRMVIEDDGDVGVGTTSPDTDFEIVGSEQIFRVTDPSSYAVIQINGASGLDSGIDYMENGDTEYSLNWDASADTFKFINKVGASTTQMVIDGSGDVGIGTDTPSTKLEVVGEAKFDGALFARGATGIGLKDDEGNLGLWVEDGGKVGIGSGMTDPSAELHLKAQTADSRVLQFGDEVFLTRSGEGILGVYADDGNNNWGAIQLGNGGPKIQSNTSGDICIGDCD